MFFLLFSWLNISKKIKEKTEENKTKGAELNPTGKKIDKKHKIAAYIGTGIIALILICMIFGFCSTGTSSEKWEFSKTTPNEMGKWYIKFTKNTDAIFKLDVEGEIPEYFIGLDFFVEDKAKGSGWTKVSDGKVKQIVKYSDLDRYLK